MKQKQRSSPARVAMKLLCTLLGIVLVVMLGGTLLFHHLLGDIQYVDTRDFPSLTQDALDTFLSVETGSSSGTSGGGEVFFEKHDTKIGGRGSNLVNILLIGQDRREGEDRARSDSMILCTFNTDTRQLTMTSFLRDLYVEIPGYASNRINAAYSAGGMALLDKTIEQNFGIHIDGNVEVDFAQFAEIVDLLGGVEIELRQDEVNVINEETGSTLTEGIQILNGQQALAYSRIRKLDIDGDFSRTNRQRKVISALLAAYQDISLTRLLPLMKQILPMISTDMNNAEILMTALELFPMLSGTQIISQRIPADGTYTDQTIDGMSVLVADMDAARQLLEQTLNGN